MTYNIAGVQDNPSNNEVLAHFPHFLLIQLLRGNSEQPHSCSINKLTHLTPKAFSHLFTSLMKFIVTSTQKNTMCWQTQHETLLSFFFCAFA